MYDVGRALSHNAAMTLAPLVPHGEALRRAVAWLAERGEWTVQRVEEACERFDVSPADEEFLLRELRQRSGAVAGHSSGSAPDPEML